MNSLFEMLSKALAEASAAALAASFAWGMISVVLSPCHLASIPLVVGYVHGRGRAPQRRALILSSVFALGITLTIGLIGLITGLAGRLLGDVGSWGQWLVVLLFIFFGLHLLDVLKLSFLDGSLTSVKSGRGAWGALILGLLFGLAVGPCTFAFVAPVLGLAFQSAAQNFAFAFGLVLVYALGHGLVIILAGTYSGQVQQFLNWNQRSHGADRLRRLCGILMLLAALVMAYKLIV